MLTASSKTKPGLLSLGLSCISGLTSAVRAQDAVPDFSGMWGRSAFNVEPLAWGPRPLANLERTPDGTGDANKLVGDYRNPILKPEAAEEAAERHMKQDGPAGVNGNVTVDPNYKGKGLQLTVTVEDPGVFTTPWSANITYRRILGPWTEQVCAETVFEYYAGRFTEIPTAAKPDF
jgi:hypothetical protein